MATMSPPTPERVRRSRGTMVPRFEHQMRRLGLAIVIIFLLVTLVAFHIHARLVRRDRALAAGATSLPIAPAFTSTLPGARHSIMYSTGQHGPPTWQSTATFFNRYVLTMQIPIRITYLGAVHQGGPPTWRFIEVAAAQRTPSGGWSIDYGPERPFAQTQWDALVAANGRIELVFPNLTTSDPAPGVPIIELNP